MTMKKIIYIITLFVSLSACKLKENVQKSASGQSAEQQTSPMNNIKEPYFHYDEVLHFDLHKISKSLPVAREGLDSTQLFLNDILMQDVPQSLKDTLFVTKLYGLNDIKVGTLPQTDYQELDEIFVEKKAEPFAIGSCIPIYRDILVFKRKGDCVGVAKICFECSQSQFVGTKVNTENFPSEKAYSRLKKLLSK